MFALEFEDWKERFPVLGRIKEIEEEMDRLLQPLALRYETFNPNDRFTRLIESPDEAWEGMKQKLEETMDDLKDKFKRLIG